MNRQDDLLLRYTFRFTSKVREHTRRIYGIFDLFGEVGGVIEILMILCQVSIGSFQEHSFLTRAISRLFLANTEDQSMFRYGKLDRVSKMKKKQKKMSHHLSQKERLKISKNQIIKLSTSQSLHIYLQELLGCLVRPRVDERLWKLYKEGQARIEKDFDIVRIIKTLRNVKLTLYQNLSDKKLKYLVKNQTLNVIDLDDKKGFQISSNSELFDVEQGQVEEEETLYNKIHPKAITSRSAAKNQELAKLRSFGEPPDISFDKRSSS